MTAVSRPSRIALYVYGLLILVVLYMPLVAVGFASVSKARYLSFPVKRYTSEWLTSSITSPNVHALVLTSLKVAVLVTLISVVIGFFGALAFARFEWKYRSLYQKLILLPIFFPQTVLGLALLIWFSAIGITPSWKTAVVAHLVWITPITTLIIAIRAYGFDPSLEEAARDMGATTFDIMREITIPLLMPGIVAAGLFAFLLSWGNFPLSLFTSGVDATLPKWLYSRMVSGFTPQIPALGMLAVAGSTVLVLAGLAIMWWLRRRA